ncbi:CDP-glucose 4,6-dehydratase [Chlorobium sp. N1]|uniref:CDP-glucose 4,6-dehydratase n=1 Tax=Chlorobium sp. N1 TaxID=2491138 RepID=UPI00103CA848|nr:CDP-glucose 4,6-dehydratase [Chlorobium sp. N1]TCD47963.1 CDP-glucose 4,6-dehydratase [Chlorobium sp. N1]
MLNRNFWSGKKVLLTGHTGFKGSWLAIWLDKLGAEVTGYALDPLTPNDNFVLSGIANRIRHHIGDVRDFDRLHRLFDEAKPEIVLHLAAQPLVRESYNTPKETYDINLGGSVNVLECCRLSDSVQVVVNVTTDKCYENREWVWGYRENDRLGGYDPYSSSKACSELVTEAYRKSFFNPEDYALHGKSVASARAGNVFGGGDWQVDRIVPDCVRHLEKGEAIVVRNPHAIRPWQHVLEPLSGYLLLAERMFEKPTAYEGAWNFGPEDSSFLTVGSLVDAIVRAWGSGAWEDRSVPGAVHEAHLLKLDITKAKALLGWSPVWKIDRAVGETIEWYREYGKGRVHELCLKQIDDYMNGR